MIEDKLELEMYRNSLIVEKIQLEMMQKLINSLVEEKTRSLENILQRIAAL